MTAGRCLASLLFIATLAAGGPFHASGATAQDVVMKDVVSAENWAAYRDKFMEENGRIVDDANGGISHSEGQGYGLLLALGAGDRASFERIWTFTRLELMIRDDGLSSWRWDPKARPNVTDINNATDGDILIAYALVQAAEVWNESAYYDAARQITRAIADTSIGKVGQGRVFMPGAHGFSYYDQPDGPVVNPSYWIFEAFPVLKPLAPDMPWEQLRRSGLDLIREARFSRQKLPAEWLSLRNSRRPQPAESFPVEFSYNAIRIPLYVLRAGLEQDGLLGPLHEAWVKAGKGVPATVDLKTGAPKQQLTDPGYRMLAATLACALDGTAIPAELKAFKPTAYYPSTLHLLSLSYVSQRHPSCL